MELRECIAGTPVKIDTIADMKTPIFGHIVRFARNPTNETIVLLMMEDGNYRSIHPANIIKLH